MKTSIFFGLITILAASHVDAAIIAGPITNPANGHEYYLLSRNTWTASEAEAERLGGTLAIIKSVGDQEWVFSTFASYGETNRNLWIGMHRSYSGGPMVWVTDTPVSYSNWERGQPDNNSGNESYVHMFCHVGDRVPGTWNDLSDAASIDGAPNCGVVEVPAKTDEKSLTGKEKALIGTWYVAGDQDHPCWISGTKDKLFQIFDQRACRLVYTVEGTILVLNPQHGIYGELVENKILWSNGTWWSREPAEFSQAKTASR
jgi:hypothetical protein